MMFLAGAPLDGPWYEATLVAQSLDTGQRHPLIQGAAQAHYVPPGYLVYARAGTLYAVPFDEKALRVTGQPVAMVEGVREDPRHGAAQFVVSANGTLAYVSGGLAPRRSSGWTDRDAPDADPAGTPVVRYPRLSPDGSRLAVAVGGGNDAIFVHDLAQGGLTRVTSDGNQLRPTWTHDGKQITTVKTETLELISSNVDRVGVEEILYRSDTLQPSPASWSSDGRVLAFTQGGDIWTLTWPERHASKLTDSRFNKSRPSISPDQRWLAYVSDESDQNEVYVQQFPGAGQRWMVSKGGGTEPVWARDSQSLYFRQGPKLMAVRGRPPFPQPVELFEAPWAVGGDTRRYDVAPDGQGFIMTRVSDAPAARIHVILNWIEELKRRVPPPTS